MAIISETYFNTVDTHWDYSGQLELAKKKGKQLFESGCLLSEFGSRRRRSYKSQDIVLVGLLAVSREMEGNGKGKLVGTSNVHFAMLMGLKPIGTMAHGEWSFRHQSLRLTEYHSQNSLWLLELSKATSERMLVR